MVSYPSAESCQRRSNSERRISRLTLANDDVGGVLRLVVEEVVEDLLRALRVADLRVERRARVVGCHAVAAAERVRHRSPRVALGRRLDVPDVAGVAVYVAALDRGGDVVGVADRATRGVDCKQAP